MRVRAGWKADHALHPAGAGRGFASTSPQSPEPRLSDDALPGEPLPRHLLPDTASVRGEGRLQIGGVGVLDIVADVGTPVFIYDEQHLRDRCREARRVFGPWVAYASKAFLCGAMARLVAEEGMAMDVSTGGEMRVALRAGVPSDRLVFHGSNKSDEELHYALAVGVGRIVVDSFDEIGRLERLVTRLGIRERVGVLVRVNPGVSCDTHPYLSTGQPESKFGLSLSSGDAEAAVERLRRPGTGIDLLGLHAHIGSQVFDLSTLRAGIKELAEFFIPLDLPELCIGGGLAVAYSGGTPAPTITEWGDAVHEACRDAGVPNVVRVTAEPGRAIAASACLTCYRIGTLKRVPGVTTYVGVDGGMSDNLRPALYGSEYEAFLPRATLAPRPNPVAIVGKHCECGDVIVKHGHLPADTVVGDVVATPVTGAYGYAMASNYNKVPRPPVVFVSEGSYRVVVRRETYDDLFRLDL